MSIIKKPHNKPLLVVLWEFSFLFFGILDYSIVFNIS